MTQVVIAIAIVIAAGVPVKRTVFSNPSNGARLPGLLVGDRLNVPTIDWAQNKKSLVFFLKKDCPYCTSSADLYRQLLTEADAPKYLQYLELPFENIYTGPVADDKLTGTPTIVFVDQDGIVKSVWIGAQTEREKEMRDTLVQLFES